VSDEATTGRYKSACGRKTRERRFTIMVVQKLRLERIDGNVDERVADKARLRLA
jgi:hypothetical protein